MEILSLSKYFRKTTSESIIRQIFKNQINLTNLTGNILGSNLFNCFTCNKSKQKIIKIVLGTNQTQIRNKKVQQCEILYKYLVKVILLISNSNLTPLNLISKIEGMRRNQSQFIKIQPFIQTLRASTNLPKDNGIDSVATNQIPPPKDILNFHERDKSLQKQKIMSIKRKQSIVNLNKNQKYTPECTYSNNQLEIDFRKICLKGVPLQDQKYCFSRLNIQNFIDIKQTKIAIVFSGKKNHIVQQTITYFQQNDKKVNETQLKMQITCFLMSIQDEFKVRRTYDINLLQELTYKQVLKIQISEGLKPLSLNLNGKSVSVKQSQSIPSRQSNKVYIFKPWNMINQRKTLLQNKILSQRPKSKIKWSFSLNDSPQKKQQQQSKIGRKSQIQENYGLKTLQQYALKDALESKNKSDLHSTKLKGANSFMNVFTTPFKEKTETISMKSTLESENNSFRNQLLTFSNESKRKNNIISSLNFNQEKIKAIGQISENRSRSNRPKSSFKSLKEKNDYFQMKESERKQSLKKSSDFLPKDLQKSKIKMQHKSSEIKQEYGIS